MNANLNSLRRKRSEVLDRRQASVDKVAGEGRALTAEEVAQDDALKLEAQNLGNTIERAEEIEREQAATARPVEEVAAPVRSMRNRNEDRPKGHNFTSCILAIAGADYQTRRVQKPISPAQFAKDVLGNDYAAAALTAGTLASGGGLIHEDVSADFIELLRAASIVRRAGANEVPIPSGNLTMNGVAGGATASWVGENAAPNASGETLRQVKLSAKKLRCVVPISNDLLRRAGNSVLQMVLNDMQATMALAEDLAFLRGPGTAFSPLGLKNIVGINTNAAQGSADLPKVTTDSGKAALNLMEDNVPFRKVFWAWAPRTSVYLENQRDSNGNKAWPEIERGTFRRYPYFETTQIPTNLGGGSNESEIYLVDAADLIIGQVPEIGARVSSEASYKDSGGTLVSAFSNDETVVDIIEEVDFATRHVESINLMTAVIWTV